MTIIILAVVILVIFFFSGSTQTETKTSLEGLNEKGLKFMTDMQSKIDNGESFLINSEYLKRFEIEVDEKFTMNQVYEQIFSNLNEKTKDHVMDLVITLKDRLRADADTFECTKEDETGEINLFNDELLVNKWSVEWKERKTITTGVTYGGVRMKGKGSFSSVFGHMNLIKHTKTEFQTYDHGNLYLTSKRLIFVGYNQKSKTIRLDRVLNLEIFQDGFYVNRENGDSPMIVPTGLWCDSVCVSKYISRVMFDDVELVTK
jgi:hypothetical protein